MGNLGRSAEHTWVLSCPERRPWGVQADSRPSLVENGSWEQDSQHFQRPRVQAEQVPTAGETLLTLQEEGAAGVGMGNRPRVGGTPVATATTVQGAAPNTVHTLCIMTVKRHTHPVLCTT